RVAREEIESFFISPKFRFHPVAYARSSQGGGPRLDPGCLARVESGDLHFFLSQVPISALWPTSPARPRPGLTRARGGSPDDGSTLAALPESSPGTCTRVDKVPISALWPMLPARLRPGTPGLTRARGGSADDGSTLAALPESSPGTCTRVDKVPVSALWPMFPARPRPGLAHGEKASWTTDCPTLAALPESSPGTCIR
ncbi:MAG: hypothetical protein GY938_27685, partial [Ketobacter sp.]|nr:hypothetical protein [Ketobacter sp.]